jgi:hypothetical protein
MSSWGIVDCCMAFVGVGLLCRVLPLEKALWVTHSVLVVVCVYTMGCVYIHNESRLIRLCAQSAFKLLLVNNMPALH